MYLIYDTETTGLPKDWNAPMTDVNNWPRCVQIAWQLHDDRGRLIDHQDYLIIPDGFDIPFESENVHGISTQLAATDGEPLEEVLHKFNEALGKANFIVGHNLGFDVNIMGCEFHRLGIDTKLTNKAVLDTCTENTAALCEIPGGRGGKFKLPKLGELHEKLFNASFEEAHNATADVEATTRCFFELIRRARYTELDLKSEPGYVAAFQEANPEPFEPVGLTHVNLKAASDKLKQPAADPVDQPMDEEPVAVVSDAPFTHLHVHSQFSVLQSTARIQGLVDKAVEYEMDALALTDLGNMYGAFKFVRAATKAGIKPIVGCELNVCENHQDRTKKDNGYATVFLAKNKNGYHNLAKLSSLALVEGFYYVPRIDRELLLQYKEDLIVLSGGTMGEITHLILNVGEQQARDAMAWWKEHFGDDYYLEICDHGLDEEKHAKQVILRLAAELDIKVIAANNTFYVNKAEADAHDVLLCIKEGENRSTPIGRGRGFRYGFPNDEFYFKSPDEMKAIFADTPEAIDNIAEVVGKCEAYTLERDVLLPAFDIPEEFKDPADEEDGGKRGENAYLRHLTYEGAKRHYGEIDDELRERIDFELATIANTGYPGYFLIVQDFTAKAREMGVSVGPGRGSAAGSVVAFCTGITNVDPIKYELLFERFLNPDRVSLPDIDIDFDDVGRGKVIDYVIDKYGQNQVAQIITYGSMAAKSSIRDAGRVLQLPLQDTDRIAKLIPDGPGWTLQKAFKEVPELNQIKAKTDLEGETLQQAEVLEGSVRNTGIHACGVIITPDDIMNHVPVSKPKDSDLLCTQFDNSVVESAGMLKMDFLGLKTLTIIKDCIEIVKARLGVEIIADEIPLDDEKTFELYQRGETNGTFQFESAGMQRYLKELVPTKFEDLIAMNALYRPGPLEYIPNFIARKHGREPIEYDLPAMEDNLANTYGITVYQEQVMLLSQKLAGFTKGEADVLRKAMGKKIKALLDELKPKFIEGCKNNGHPEDKAEKIWKDWEAFAAYAFNKSHSTCYSVVAFQTAYLKAHYPAEYMAAVLTNNMSDIKKVTFFMEECRRMGLKVLGPDVNESYFKFAVNKNGEVRFGLGAIKGVGEAAVKSLVDERKENGPFTSVFDLVSRIDLKATNKKTMEGLTLAGGLDSFGTTRAQYFHEDENGMSFLEKVIKYGQAVQKNAESNQGDLFGEADEAVFNEPTPPECEPWSRMERLSKEKEVVGIYISGHPLNDYRYEVENFTQFNLSHVKVPERMKHAEFGVAGMVLNVEHRTSKSGKPFGTFEMEDYNDTHKFFLFGEDYMKFKHMLTNNVFLFVKGKVQPRWHESDQWEFKINNIDLLSEVKEKYTKSIKLTFDTSIVNDDFVQEVTELMTNNSGTTPVKVTILDTEEQLAIESASRGLRVTPTTELLEKLEEIGGMKVELLR